MEMLIVQALTGAVKLFVYLGLPFVLLTYAFGMMAGERLEYGKFTKTCTHFLAGAVHAIFRGVGIFSTALSHCLPAHYAKWRAILHVLIHALLIVFVSVTILASLARFAATN